MRAGTVYCAGSGHGCPMDASTRERAGSRLKRNVREIKLKGRVRLRETGSRQTVRAPGAEAPAGALNGSGPPAFTPTMPHWREENTNPAHEWPRNRCHGGGDGSPEKPTINLAASFPRRGPEDAADHPCQHSPFLSGRDARRDGLAKLRNRNGADWSRLPRRSASRCPC
ncbi:hypothetical protein BOO71_0013999 [Deinococcus marmoris]|uniref:Uncharacterized protein n=1 Tax=Deinococcus marmoris TaxID=249408 RepID=A0A1U7NS92_9DEIO|nr:hypothetical protein BOO71_0013999 [Deinococcus marmoris]